MSHSGTSVSQARCRCTNVVDVGITFMDREARLFCALCSFLLLLRPISSCLLTSHVFHTSTQPQEGESKLTMKQNIFYLQQLVYLYYDRCGERIRATPCAVELNYFVHNAFGGVVLGVFSCSQSCCSHYSVCTSSRGWRALSLRNWRQIFSLFSQAVCLIVK